jgi:hypothetical protein
MYIIWSHRKKQWWRAERAGYTDHVSDAGRYTREEAGDITLDCLPGQNVAISGEGMIAKFTDMTPPEVIKTIDSYRNF